MKMKMMRNTHVQKLNLSNVEFNTREISNSNANLNLSMSGIS